MAKKIPMKIERLQVKPKLQVGASPCAVELAALLTCWRTNGVDNSGCQALVEGLRNCTKTKVSKKRLLNL